MATQTGLPSNLYSGDAVVLNNDRYTQYYLQKAAQKQAKSEALDRYYNDLNKNVNPAGMRLQDLEGGFNKDVNDWRQHYIQNADKIKNPQLDNGRAYNEHFSKYQQLLSKTQESKNAAIQEHQIAQAKLSGKYEPTDDDMKILHGIGASIYSPEHYTDPESKVQPYSLEHLSPSVPEFDAKKQAGFIKGATSMYPVKPTADYEHSVIDKKAGLQYIPKYHQYNDAELKGIGDQAADLYDGDKSARKYFQLAAHSPEEHADLNDAFKKVYGHDATTPKELAQGWALSHANKRVDMGTDTRKYVNPDTYYSHLGAREASQKRMVNYRKAAGLSAGTESGTDPIESLMQDQESAAKAAGNHPYIQNGEHIPMYELKAPLEMKKALLFRDGAKTYQPDQVKIDDNGDYHGIFYKRDATTGEPIKSENGTYVVDPKIPMQTVSRDAMKVSLGKEFLTKKENQRIMSAPKAVLSSKKQQSAEEKADALLKKYGQ